MKIFIMKIGSLAILLLFLNSAAFAQTKGDRGYRVKIGDMAPNVVLHLTDGTTTSLQQLRGKVVVSQLVLGMPQRDAPFGK